MCTVTAYTWRSDFEVVPLPVQTSSGELYLIDLKVMMSEGRGCILATFAHHEDGSETRPGKGWNFPWDLYKELRSDHHEWFGQSQAFFFRLGGQPEEMLFWRYLIFLRYFGIACSHELVPEVVTTEVDGDSFEQYVFRELRRLNPSPAVMEN